MSAYHLIESVIAQNFEQRNLDKTGICSCCGSEFSSTLKLSKNDFSCLVCSFLITPNPNVFGMLTSNRAHCPTSFLNSLLLFVEGEPITLVTTKTYASQIPLTNSLKVVVDTQDNFIIKCLNNPSNCVCMKTSMNIRDYISTLVVSTHQLFSLVSSRGVFNINIHDWKVLIEIAKSGEKEKIQKCLDIFENITRGSDLKEVSFVKENYVLFSRVSELLDVLPHSKLYLIRLLRRALDET